MITPVSIWIARWKHRLLNRFSRAYRDFDEMRQDRDKWRRDCIVEGNKSTELARKVASLDKMIDSLGRQATSETTAKEQATMQLLSERTLRQAAELRASNYHDELVDALKESANWASKHVNQRAMYTGVASPPEPQVAGRQTEPIGRSKPFARDIGRKVSDVTLRSVLEEIRSGGPGSPDELQVGPEFTSSIG